MSHSLLSQPEKLHDITDDLESLFWVLVYGAMKWHALPDQNIPLEGFDQFSLDGHGRRVGGGFKGDWILSGDALVRLRLTCPALHKLIKDCRLGWWKLYNAKHGARDFEDMEDFHAEIMKMLELAGKPSFWIEKYSAILSTWDVPPPPTVAPASTIPSEVPAAANSLPADPPSPLAPSKPNADPPPFRRSDAACAGVKRGAETPSSAPENAGAAHPHKKPRRSED